MKVKVAKTLMQWNINGVSPSFEFGQSENVAWTTATGVQLQVGTVHAAITCNEGEFS